MNKLSKVIISGGGTGGHIYPAVAIANAVRKQFPDVDILFIGAKGKMEMEKVPAAGYSIKGLWISGLQRRLTWKNLLFPMKLVVSMVHAIYLVKRFNPDVVVGVGGFASGPTLRAAAILGIPSLIQEQNSYPGITNKILASKVQRICVAYPEMERFFPIEKICTTGNPVRQDIIQLDGKESEAATFFNISPDRKVLLVIGGSLGARTINEAMLENLRQLVDANVQVIWQTGKGYHQKVCMAAKSFIDNDNVKVYDFITRMDLAYAIADVVVSRAGALSIAELCVTAKPSILIPSPNVAEDHQTKNAMALVKKNAALYIADAEAINKLGEEALRLITNPYEMELLSKNIKQFAFVSAADDIVQELIKLTK